MTASGLRTGKVAHDLFLLRGVSECLEIIGVPCVTTVEDKVQYRYQDVIIPETDGTAYKDE